MRPPVDHADGPRAFEVHLLEGGRYARERVEVERMEATKHARRSHDVEEARLAARDAVVEAQAVEELHARRRLVVHKVLVEAELGVRVGDVYRIGLHLDVEYLAVDGALYGRDQLGQPPHLALSHGHVAHHVEAPFGHVFHPSLFTYIRMKQ